MCHAVAKQTQQDIDAAQWPEPVNPEDRALKLIAHYRQWLLDHPKVSTRIKQHVARQISRLEAEFALWVPTKYKPVPGVKGGK